MDLSDDIQDASVGNDFEAFSNALLSRKVSEKSEIAEAESAPVTTADNAVEVETSEQNHEVSEGGADEANPEELTRGHLRHEDYTKKTMELADQRRQFESEREQFKAQLEAQKAQLAQQFAQAQQVVDSGNDPIIADANRTDWAKLAQEDPAAYVQKRAIVEDRLAQIDAIKKENARIQKEQLVHAVNYQAGELVKRIPEWKDQTVATKELTAVRQWLVSGGFSQDDVNKTIDARLLTVARKAMLYDRLQQAKQTVDTKKVNTTAKVIKPRGGEVQKANPTQKILQQAKKQKGGVTADQFHDVLMSRRSA